MLNRIVYFHVRTFLPAFIFPKVLSATAAQYAEDFFRTEKVLNLPLQYLAIIKADLFVGLVYTLTASSLCEGFH